jgi:hypothetical protein
MERSDSHIFHISRFRPTVTAAGMEAQQNFAAKADAYRTPKTKRKRQSLEVPAAIGISPYKRQS